MKKNIIKIMSVLLTFCSTISFADQVISSGQPTAHAANQTATSVSNYTPRKPFNMGYQSSQRTTPNQTLRANIPAYYSSSGNSGQTSYSNRYHPHHHRHHNSHISFGFTTVSPMVVPAPTAVYVSNAHSYYAPIPPYGNSLMWVDGGETVPVPADFVAGGGDRIATYPICRAFHKGSNHPGKLIDGRCHISYGGQELSYYRYQVLTSQFPLAWSAGSNGYIPPGAVFAGREHGRPLFICQAVWQGSMQPGKIVGNMCNIAYQGKELALTHYNVLVV